MSAGQKLRDSEIEYCKKHPIYFTENWGHIEDHEAAERGESLIQPFYLWEMQRKALEDLATHKRVIILKARQLGISWLVLHYIVNTLLTPGKTAIGLSKSETEAKELIRRTVFILSCIPELIVEKRKRSELWSGAWYESTALELTMHFGDVSSTFQCFASSESAARSFTADILFFDEWAFQQYDRQIWQAAYPTINRPSSGQVIGVSTIKRGSLFEEKWSDENNFYKIFLPWNANPERTKEWYEQTKSELGDLIYAEYPATVEEALMVPGGAFFPEVTNESILTNDMIVTNRVTYFCMDYGLDKLAAYWINMDAFGNAQIVYELYESDMTIGAAVDSIRKIENRLIDTKMIEKVKMHLAPKDLWNREQVQGKSRAVIFAEFGLNLVRSNSDVAAGCSALKEYLSHGEGQKGKLTILHECAPNLLRCLKKIQKDENRPNIYANSPHELTHSIDAIRYWAIYWTHGGESNPREHTVTWRRDQWEDFRNANEADRKYLMEIWGKPR